MSDTHPIWDARKAESLSREQVVRLLEPPITTKTLERWERCITPAPKWRVRQLAQIYRVKADELEKVA